MKTKGCEKLGKLRDERAREIPWMRRTDDVENVRQMRNDAIFHQPTILVAFEPANRKIARSLAGKIVKRDFCVLTQSKKKLEISIDEQSSQIKLTKNEQSQMEIN